RRLVRQRCMKRRVEHSDVWHIGYRAACFLERDQRGTVVQRRELCQRVELALDLCVDDNWITEAQTTVHDAVRDRVDSRRNGVERFDRLGSAVVRDRRELEARRASVDDKDGYTGIVGNSRWPPKALRIAESSLSAYSDSPREANRWYSAAESTGTGTPSSIAARIVQRPSPESDTRPP